MFYIYIYSLICIINIYIYIHKLSYRYTHISYPTWDTGYVALVYCMFDKWHIFTIHIYIDTHCIEYMEEATYGNI